jgi:hypothetical protein
MRRPRPTAVYRAKRKKICIINLPGKTEINVKTASENSLYVYRNFTKDLI